MLVTAAGQVHSIALIHVVAYVCLDLAFAFAFVFFAPCLSFAGEGEEELRFTTDSTRSQAGLVLVEYFGVSQPRGNGSK